MSLYFLSYDKLCFINITTLTYETKLLRISKFYYHTYLIYAHVASVNNDNPIAILNILATEYIPTNPKTPEAT